MNTYLKRALSLVITTDSTPVKTTKALKAHTKKHTKTPLLKLGKKSQEPRKLTERELIQLESKIGVTVFGQLPAHVKRREFFNLDETTWIWHEEVVTKDGKTEELTTRYEVQPKGILKVQPNYHYSYLEGAELQNFVLAVKEYHDRVMQRLYHREPQAQ